MMVTIKELNRGNLKDVDQCDSTFTVDSKLVFTADEQEIRFTIADVPLRKKRYPPEAIDYGGYIGAPDRIVFLAYVGSQVVGQARLRANWNRFAYIDDIVVDMKFRRHGVGQALVEAAVEWAKGKRLAGVMLETQDNNVAACLFYQKCGFEIGGFDRRVYRGIDGVQDEVAVYWYLVLGG